MNMRDPANAPPTMPVGARRRHDRADAAGPHRRPRLGLENVGHRVLTYRDLVALEPEPRPAPAVADDGDPPDRQHGTVHVVVRRRASSARWSEPIRFARNERVRVTLVNDTMMAHPIHLHGHFFELVNGASPAITRSSTRSTSLPGGKVTFDLTADAPGDWAFHCHLLYPHARRHVQRRQRPPAGGRWSMNRLLGFAAAMLLTAASSAADAQHAGHSMPSAPARQPTRTPDTPWKCRPPRAAIPAAWLLHRRPRRPGRHSPARPMLPTRCSIRLPWRRRASGCARSRAA